MINTLERKFKMKNLIALALAASLVACTSENTTTTPAPEAPEAPVVDATGGPCGDGRELGPNEVCP
jgi:hypothetical protein